MLRFLSGTTWGADRAVLLRFYQALVLSRLDYGSAAYGSARPATLKMLDSIHHSGVRLATGAFRTSPIPSLLAESGVPPLNYRRQHMLLAYAANVRQMPQHPTYQALFGTQNHQGYANRPRATRPVGIRLDSSCTEIGVAVGPCMIRTSSEVPPWQVPRPEIRLDLHRGPKVNTDASVYRRQFHSIVHQFPDAGILYTDGSKVDEKVGCAYVIDGANTKISLPEACSVFTAELVAIYEALQFALQDARIHFLVCTDSLSSLQSIATCFPQHPLVQRIHDLLAGLCHADTRITFLWLPSHMGIAGNELADQAAKEAVSLPPRPMEVPARDIRSQLRLQVLAFWESQWLADPLPSKLRAIKGTTRVWRSSFRARRESVILCRLRIGHTRSTHSYLMRREDPPLCTCGAVFTVAHIFTECVDLADLRRNFGLQMTL